MDKYEEACKRFLNAESLLILMIPALSGCVAMGLAGAEVAAVASAAVVTSAVISKNAAPPEIKVYGTYRDGFWFDRDLYNVWVIANTPEEAERIAIETANKSCADRSGFVQLERFNAWQERALFIPVKIARFSYDVRFRCAAEAAPKQ